MKKLIHCSLLIFLMIATKAAFAAKHRVDITKRVGGALVARGTFSTRGELDAWLEENRSTGGFGKVESLKKRSDLTLEETLIAQNTEDPDVVRLPADFVIGPVVDVTAEVADQEAFNKALAGQDCGKRVMATLAKRLRSKSLTKGQTVTAANAVANFKGLLEPYSFQAARDALVAVNGGAILSAEDKDAVLAVLDECIAQQN